jgi:4-hydroxyphenylpyruvate dioxygenase-like putative hemolysin
MLDQVVKIRIGNPAEIETYINDYLRKNQGTRIEHIDIQLANTPNNRKQNIMCTLLLGRKK